MTFCYVKVFPTELIINYRWVRIRIICCTINICLHPVWSVCALLSEYYVFIYVILRSKC